MHSLLLLPLVYLNAAQAQQQPPAPAGPMPKAFEVASIKPNAANDNRVMLRMAPGGSFTATGVTLKLLISQAYDMRNHQIIGGPGWMDSDRFDINAKGPEGMPDRVPPEVLRPMLRALVEDRFQLKYHTEERELPVYVLVQGKGGHKMKVAETPAAGGPPGGNRRVMVNRGELHAQSAPIALLVQQLAQQLGRTVIDKTGLTGAFDFDLQWTPDGPREGGGAPPASADAIAASDSSGPTIFTALQEKLGLRLESQKGPVPVLLIDSVSKPTEN